MSDSNPILSHAAAQKLCRALGVNSKSAPYRGYRVNLSDGRAVVCDPKTGAFTITAAK